MPAAEDPCLGRVNNDGKEGKPDDENVRFMFF